VPAANKAGSVDAKIEDGIREQLFWSPVINEAYIEVDVKNGIAYLSGTVDTWYEKTAARQGAWRAGARQVVTDIEVTQAPNLRKQRQAIRKDEL
jgi:osmotically-inducible protein OsmY